MGIEDKKQAEQELEEVLQKWVHVFGPHKCDNPYHDHDPEEVPDGMWLPSGWVIAIDWSSTETGDTWTTILAPDSAPRSQKIGLSEMALNTFI